MWDYSFNYFYFNQSIAMANDKHTKVIPGGDQTRGRVTTPPPQPQPQQPKPQTGRITTPPPKPNKPENS
jgi:heme-binding NEAT domain protein